MNLAPSYLHCNEPKPGVLLVCDIRNELTFEESLEAVAQFKREILEEQQIGASMYTEDELLDKASDLFRRLGGIGNSDARIVRGLIERTERKPCIGGYLSPSGTPPMWINFENEDFTWDELAEVLAKRFGKSDIEELIRLLGERLNPDTEVSCRTCEHDGQQHLYRVACTGCGTEEESRNYSRKVLFLDPLHKT